MSDDSGVIGIPLQELLTEMRDEIRALRSVVTLQPRRDRVGHPPHR